MVKKIFLASTVLFMGNLYAQTGDWKCGFTDFPDEEKTASCSANSSTFLNKYRLKETYTADKSEIGIKTMHINMVIIQKGDGSGNWNSSNLARINQVWDWVNMDLSASRPPDYPIQPVTVLSDTKVRVVVDGIYFIKDQTPDLAYYNGPGNGSTGYASNQSLNNFFLTNYPNASRAYNYFLTGGVYPINGVAGFTDSYGIQSFYRALPPMETDPVHDWNLAHHFAHELGHAIGLNHTYSSNFQNCNPSNLDFLSDVYNLSQSCLPSCQVCTMPAGALNNNIMGGGQSWAYISVLQTGLIHRTLMRTTGFNTIEGNMRNHTTGYSSIPWTVSTNETWDFPIKMYQDLVVKPGTTLTIKCRVEFVPQASLIIEPGAQVILDGGTLTNEYYYNQMWKGVQVWGNYNQNQYPLSAPTNQGKFSIINGGILENAEMGVRLWKPDDWAKTGGVVVTNDATFKNCGRAVEFMSYKNTSPSNSSIELSNLSSFKNTNFIINSNYLNDKNSFQTFVSLFDVNGVNFVDCNFENQCTGLTYSPGYNKGIISLDAGYNVGASCSSIQPVGTPCPPSDLNKSTFKNLSFGVEAQNSNSTKVVKIDQCDFINVVNGFKAESENNFIVTRNNFSLGSSNIIGAVSTNGITSNASSGYKIEENIFSPSPGNTISSTGVKINSSGATSNRAYKNTFNNLSYGNFLSGVNRSSSNSYVGYQILCNTFSGISNVGFNVQNTNNTSHGVRSFQGENNPLLSSGNQYLSHIGSSVEVFNGSTWPMNYYHNGGVTLPTSVSGAFLFQTNNLNTCVSSFGTQTGVSQKMSNLSTLQSNKSDLEFNLLALLDGGNSDILQSQIENDWSNDAWGLRNMLLDKSPYLTQENMLRAFGNDYFPDAMVLEVSLANPEATRGEEYLRLLKQVRPNVSQYVINTIRQSWTATTSRQAIEGELGSVIVNIDLIRNELISQVLTEELENKSIVENLISEASNDQLLSDKIENLLEKNLFEDAKDVLNSSTFLDKDISAKEMFNSYGEYILFRENLYNSNKTLFELDENDVNFLRSHQYDDSKVGSYCRGILCFVLNDCIDFEKISVKNDIIAIEETQDKMEFADYFYSLELFPNPTINYTIVKLDILESISDAKLVVTNINGEVLLTNNLTQEHSEIVLDLEKFESGIYFVNVFNKGQLQKTEKLIISSN